jgi:ribosomal-protein-serine acetyltransferase
MLRLAVAPDIEIRQWTLDDADACFEVVARNRDSLREWLPWVERTYTAEDTRDYMRTVAIPQYEANQGPNCGVWVAGNLAGSIGCHPVDWANRTCSIGYWLDAGVRSRGVMTKCCAALLRYLFEELKLHRVSIRCATGNMRSCAIPQRLGFRREGLALEAQWVAGRWLDLVDWAILEDEWRRRVACPSLCPASSSTLGPEPKAGLSIT